MTDRVAVSVVIPAHNAEAFLGNAIRSVLAQDFKDYEIIVVDDGSQDGTEEVARSFGEQVRYTRQLQGGASRARNHAISISHGEFIAFLDADDIWFPTKLGKQVECFRSDPELGLVSTCAEYHTARGVWFDREHKLLLFRTKEVARSLVLHSGLGTPTVMVPRRVLDEVGLFDEELRIAEDDNLWTRIAARYPSTFVDEVLVRIHGREGSLSSDTDRLVIDVLRNLDILLERYPEVRKEVAGVVHLRRSRTYCDLGYHRWDLGNHGEARRALRSALRHNWRNGRAWKYLGLSLFPSRTVRSLRRIRSLLS